MSKEILRAALRARPRRSCLYVPGTNARALAKARAGAIRADSFIFDLEDAVAASAKGEARENVATLLGEWDDDGEENPGSAVNAVRRERIVRVNGLDTPWGLDDLHMVSTMAGAVDTVAVPKVECAADVWRVERHLDEFGKASSAGASSLGLALMIETPKGVLRAAEIAAASENVVCLIMGTSDLTNELRAQHTPGREPMLASLGLCVLAARAHGVQVRHLLFLFVSHFCLSLFLSKINLILILMCMYASLFSFHFPPFPRSFLRSPI